MLARWPVKSPLEFWGFILFLLCSLGVYAGGAAGQQAVVPNLFDPRERMTLPDLSGVDRVRFLTTTDFPPFNFLDQNGRLAGFHVDLARAICGELGIEPRCQIQALPWDELDVAVEAGEGEAIIAGVRVTAESRQRYAFTRTILGLPARFVVREEDGGRDKEAVDALEEGARVGVLQRSAHAAMLRAYFPDLTPIAFTDASFLFDALKEGRVAAIFGDGVQMSFWLGSEDAAECCGFLDGPFLSEEYLGHGLSIAVSPDLPQLAEAFDYALLALNENGRFAELYLRYFPNGLY